ncbi:MAG: hypothetical protein ACXACW_13330 [Candidatus Hodarchaeales archaeon]
MSTSLIHSAYGAEGTPGCGMFEIREGCELGGWMHLILGDVAIGALLAVFLHTLAHRSNKKIEHNAKAIQEIVATQELQRNRRKDFAVFNLKNLFNTLLHVMGQVNKSTFNFNETMQQETNREQRVLKRSIILGEIKGEEERVARIINSIRSNLLAANDVIEPDVVNQIEGICTYLSEIYAIESLDGVMTLPKYHVSKKKIGYVIEKLSTYTVEYHAFKEIKNGDQKALEIELTDHSKISPSMVKEMTN